MDGRLIKSDSRAITTVDQTHEDLSLREQIARIDKDIAQTHRLKQEHQLASWQLVITGAGAGAAFFAAGAAFVKLLG